MRVEGTKSLGFVSPSMSQNFGDQNATPRYGDPAAPYEWAKAIMPELCQLPSIDEVKQRIVALKRKHGDAVQLWEPGKPEKLMAAISSQEDRDAVADMPPFVTVGTGKIRIAVIASPHADEPAGVLSALTLLEGFFTEAARDWRDKVTLFVVPMAYPRGYADNWPWMEAANRFEPHANTNPLGSHSSHNTGLATAANEYMRAWLASYHREAPDASREHGYVRGEVADNSDASFLPECRAIASFLDRAIKRVDGPSSVVALHGNAIGGGSLILLFHSSKDQQSDSKGRNVWSDCLFLGEAMRCASTHTGVGLEARDLSSESIGYPDGSQPLPPPSSNDARVGSLWWVLDKVDRVVVTEPPLFLCQRLSRQKRDAQWKNDCAIAQGIIDTRDIEKFLRPSYASPVSLQSQILLQLTAVLACANEVVT